MNCISQEESFARRSALLLLSQLLAFMLEAVSIEAGQLRGSSEGGITSFRMQRLRLETSVGSRLSQLLTSPRKYADKAKNASFKKAVTTATNCMADS